MSEHRGPAPTSHRPHALELAWGPEHTGSHRHGRADAQDTGPAQGLRARWEAATQARNEHRFSQEAFQTPAAPTTRLPWTHVKAGTGLDAGPAPAALRRV